MSTAELNATAASLLGFLHAGEMTGWDLDRVAHQSIGNFWNVTRSQVYRELRTLDDLGFIEVGEAGPRDRRPYRITAAGRDAFAAWIARDPGQPLIRMPLLLTVFFGAHLPEGRLGEIIASQRPAHVAALEQFGVMYEAWRQTDPYVASVIRFGMSYHEQMLAWLDTLEPAPAPAPAPVPARRRRRA